MAPALLPRSATATGRRVVQARAARGFADGLVGVLLATRLTALGLSPDRVGAAGAAPEPEEVGAGRRRA